jgi:hypothetical protein
MNKSFLTIEFWRPSKKQNVLACSSAEAEFRVMAQLIFELL